MSISVGPGTQPNNLPYSVVSYENTQIRKDTNTKCLKDPTTHAVSLSLIPLRSFESELGAGGVEIAEFPRMTTVQRHLNPLLVTCWYHRWVSVHWVLSEVPIHSLPHSQTIQMCSICITCVIITYGTVSNIKQCNEFNEFNSPDSFLQVRFSCAYVLLVHWTSPEVSKVESMFTWKWYSWI